MASINQLPKARRDNLIIKELADETLVYDRETDRAHCLNETAARVWQYCDGTRTVDNLREVLAEKAGSPVPEELVWLALAQLEEFKLLDFPVKSPAGLSGMSRRQMVRLVGVAAIALPIVTSIIAPKPASAASPGPPGTCCQNGPQCISGTCNVNDPTCAPLGFTKRCA